jgi:hypothetical protein
MDARDLEGLTVCRRCGAAVARMSKHREWHENTDGWDESGSPKSGQVWFA